MTGPAAYTDEARELQAKHLAYLLLPFALLIAYVIFFSDEPDLQVIPATIFFYVIFRYFVVKQAENEDRLFVLKLFHISLLLRCSWVLIAYYALHDFSILKEDMARYDLLGRALIDFIQGKSDLWLRHPGTYQAKGYYAYLASVYYLFDYSLLAVFISHVFLSAASATLVFSSAKLLFGEKIGRMSGWLMVAFLPTYPLDSALWKEALVIFLVSLLCYRIIRLQKKRKRVKNLVWILILLMWLYFTRIYYALFFLPALGLILFLEMPTKIRVVALFGAAALAVLLYIELQSSTSMGMVLLTSKRLTSATGIQSVDSIRGPGIFLALMSYPMIIMKAPFKGASYLLIKPPPFYIQGFTTSGSLDFDTTIWVIFSVMMWVLLLGILWALLKSFLTRTRETVVLWSMISIAALFFGLVDMTFRYKLATYPIVFILAAYGWENRGRWIGWTPFFLLFFMLVALVGVESKMHIFGLM